jgi:hypothetical protein
MDAKIHSVIKMDEVHNIVDTQNGWGQLESGTWINLKFTVPYENGQEVAEIPVDFVTGMSVVEENKVEEPVVSTTEATTDVVMPEEKPKQSNPKYKLYKVKKGGISGESLWDIAE